VSILEKVGCDHAKAVVQPILETLRSKLLVTPGFKEQSRVHLIYAPKKTTHIITECIEINVINIINILIT
jgi:hypothetical protein